MEKDLAEEFQLPLRVAYSNLRGFYAQMHYNHSIPELPDKFIKVSISKRTISFITDELVIQVFICQLKIAARCKSDSNL